MIPSSSQTVVPLRSTRRDATRAQIVAAAKEMFFVRGYAAPTMEQIAQRASVQRSTLYTHFRDKEEVLAAIVADYTIGLRALIDRLPGPVPSTDEIRHWIGAFATFAREQRAPTELLVTAGSMAQMPEPVRAFGDTFVRMLGERLPAFERAVRLRGGMAHAWAMATLRELGWALCFYAQHGDGEESASRLAVATILFNRFVQEEG